MRSSIKISVKVVLAVILLLCLFDMPYGYFQFVRFLGMAVFCWLAYQDIERKDKTLLIFWIVSILLFNPFIKVSLGRTMWNVVDVLWAIVLMLTICTDIIARKKDDQNNI